MRINNIIKCDMETRAKDLKGSGKTLGEIAKILSDESKTPITVSTVFRYFESNEKAMIQAIEKSDKLKSKVADAEINTITKRVEIIDHFLEVADEAQECGDFKAAVMALRGATEAQDSLDERLGKLKGSQPTNINILNVQEAVNSAREVLSSRIDSIAARVGENGFYQ